MSDGIKYDWAIDAKLASVEAGVKTLDQAIKNTDKLAMATKGAETEFDRLSKRLSELEAPGKLQSLKAKIAELEHPTKKTHEGFKGVGHAIEETKGKAIGFGEAIGAVLAFEFLKEGVGLIREIGSEIIKAAAGSERMALSFKLVAGNEGARELLHWIDKIASKTEYTDDQLKGWSIQLLNAGVKVKDVDKYIAAGLDVAAKGGDMGGAIDALSRANLTGKIEGRALRGLRIGMEQIKTLPEFKGLTDKQLDAKLEKTPITKAQVMKLIAGSDNQLGDLGLQAGQTMGARIKNLKTLPEQYMQKFEESPAFETFKEKLGEIFDSLDPNSERGEKIFKSLERSFTKVVDVVASINFEHWAEVIETKVVPAFETITGMIKPIVDAVMQMIDGFKIMGKGVEVMQSLSPAGLAKSGFGYFKELLTGSKDGEPGRVERANKALLGSSPLMAGAADMGAGFNLKDWQAQHRNDAAEYLGVSVPRGMAKGITDGASLVSAASDELGMSAIDAMSSKLDAHSPSRVFEDLGANAGQGFILGIDKSKRGIDDVVQGAFAIPAPGGGRTLGAMGGDITISIPVTVHGGGGADADELGRQLGEKVREVVLPMLIDALEQAGAEAGA